MFKFSKLLTLLFIIEILPIANKNYSSPPAFIFFQSHGIIEKKYNKG